MFKGREVYYPELGKQIADRIAEQVQNVAKIESEARLDGRNMVMVLVPDKRAVRAASTKSSVKTNETKHASIGQEAVSVNDAANDGDAERTEDKVMVLSEAENA